MAGVAVGDAGCNEHDTNEACQVEQHENGNTIAMAKNIVRSVLHKFVGARYSRPLFVEKINHIHVTRRAAEIRQQSRGFSTMLCAVIDDMHHHLP